MKLRELTGTVQRVEPTRAYIATDTGLEVVTLPDPGPAEFGPLHLYLLGKLGEAVWCYCRVEELGMVLEVAAQPPIRRVTIEPDRPRHLRVVE